MKKLILRTLFAVLLLIGAFMVLGGCEGNKYPITLDFTLIGKGNVSGSGAENLNKQNVVITDSIQWQHLLSEMDSHRSVSSSLTETNIDFDKFQLIVIIDSVRPNLCEINIKSITENKSDISVCIEKTSYDATVVTQPFCIVKIGKTNKNINFIKY
jgi:lipoprotein